VPQIVAVQKIGLPPFGVKAFFQRIGDGGFSRTRESGKPDDRWPVSDPGCPRLLVDFVGLPGNGAGSPKRKIQKTAADSFVGFPVNEDETSRS